MRFEVMLRRIKKEIPVVKGCTQCGQCCGPLKCHPHEIDKIRKYIMVHEQWGVVKMNVEAHKAFQEKTGVESCYLLKLYKGKSYCLAYPMRPIVCRLYGIKATMPCKNIKKVPFRMTQNISMYYISLETKGVELNREIEQFCETFSL